MSLVAVAEVAKRSGIWGLINYHLLSAIKPNKAHQVCACVLTKNAWVQEELIYLVPYSADFRGGSNAAMASQGPLG